jgi:hypothetical protein
MAKSKKPTSESIEEYEVGFMKPPKANRFVKGQSGNPSGRPKGTNNWATTFKAALQQKVIITENGRQRQVTKMEAATMQLANKAAAGDPHSIRLMMQLVPSMEAELNKEGFTALSQAQDQVVLGELLKRMQESNIEVISNGDPSTSSETKNTKDKTNE